MRGPLSKVEEWIQVWDLVHMSEEKLREEKKRWSIDLSGHFGWTKAESEAEMEVIRTSQGIYLTLDKLGI